MVSSDSKLLAALAHALGILTSALPIGALIIWLLKKDEDMFVANHAKEALNFQLTFLIASLVAALLIIVFVGIILLPIVGIVFLVFSILATIAAAGGESYRYPISIRFVS